MNIWRNWTIFTNNRKIWESPLEKFKKTIEKQNENKSIISHHHENPYEDHNQA